MSEVLSKGKAAKAASYAFANVTTEEKNAALHLIAEQILTDEKEILEANEKDLKLGKENNLSTAVLDRILLSSDRMRDMSEAIKLLVDLKDPIGDVIETIEKENGLHIEKRRVPIGVIGMIYEARPNVTIDAATLSLKTGNAVVLRGSSSAIHSNKALVQSIHKALEKSDLPVDSVQLIEDTSREKAKDFFRMNDYLDVLIPRGSEKLIEVVLRESTVPVIETGAGNCHLFVDASADPKMAKEIVLNAKLQRPSVCNAIEAVLIEKSWFDAHGLDLIERLAEKQVSIFGDNEISQLYEKASVITEEDWYTEYLDLAIRVKVVEDCEAAIEHINKYGTHHSEGIVTEDEANKQKFLQSVDAAAVYHNASTRFTDGFEFGYGAEIGISTQKLHARGPMGLKALTSSKFVIEGTGQIRQ